MLAASEAEDALDLSKNTVPPLREGSGQKFWCTDITMSASQSVMTFLRASMSRFLKPEEVLPYSPDCVVLVITQLKPAEVNCPLR